ncbi:MAG: N-acetylmuramoyl-L-alanine amidase [Chthonomonadetes bacterium]|nr:N-acetylmuramoyl-L-alanine amidase [Chthonomonadetes bacterium]
MTLIPRDWLPACSMKRVICHWTAGGYKATSLDRAHYHILIEDDGNLVRGTHSIADNVSTGDGVYAAHTRGCNTGSIGVTVCCMAGAQAQPFQPGSYPMTQKQWETMAQVVAELCRFYEIPVTPQTVLGHGEVETYLGIPQHGKWDPMVLPWSPGMSRTQVGNHLRALVQKALSGGDTPETPSPATLQVAGKSFPVVLLNEAAYVAIRPLAESLGWTIKSATGGQVKVQAEDRVLTLASTLVGGKGHVACRDLAQALGLAIEWDASTRTITIG